MLKQLGIILVLFVISVQAQPNRSARDYYRTAVAHLNAKEYQEAVADFDKAIELEPTFPEALFYRITTLAQIDPHSEPVNDWDRIIEVAPRYKLIYYIYQLRANYRARIGQFDASIDDVNKALEFTPDDGSLYHLRGFSYVMKSEMDRAYADYKKSVELQTRLQNPLLTRGYVFIMRREFDRAVDDYTRALEWNPNDAIAYVDRGAANILMGKIDPGLADIKKGMSMDRVSIAERAVEGFACPFCALNNYVKAHPLDVRAYEARGILRLLQQQEANAKAEFEKCLSLEPQFKREIELVTQEIKKWN